VVQIKVSFIVHGRIITGVKTAIRNVSGPVTKQPMQRADASLLLAAAKTALLETRETLSKVLNCTSVTDCPKLFTKINQCEISGEVRCGEVGWGRKFRIVRIHVHWTVLIIDSS
jgi:hypothetical protein